MSNSNGRIFATSQNGVDLGDLRTVVPVVIQATIGGETVTRVSSDVGVLCSAKVGDRITDTNGVVWTVVTRSEVNPWARYRPIPCANGNINTPQPLTPAERMTERYGIEPPIDMFTADNIQQFEDYANSMKDYNSYFLKLRPWGDTHIRRLSDFAKEDNQREKVPNIGYDHNAQMDNVKITISSGNVQGTFYLKPVVPENLRTLYIPSGSTSARFQLPNDHRWMDIYYSYIWGTSFQVITLEANEEWLSPIDLMGANTYGITYASVLRRTLIFIWADSQMRQEGDPYYNADDAQWHFYNYVTDKVGGSLPEADRDFATYPNAYIDLTDTAGTDNCYYSNMNYLRTLHGKCLFIDCWLQSNSSTNVLPIPGFTYEVNIIRSANPDPGVDIYGLITFTKMERIGGQIWLYVEIDNSEINTSLASDQQPRDVFVNNYVTLYYQGRLDLETQVIGQIDFLDYSAQWERLNVGPDVTEYRCHICDDDYIPGEPYEYDPITEGTVYARPIGETNTSSKHFNVQQV